jgi:pyruvate kinase
MLQSMVNNARPTRAEISDVTNAVYDGTDCVMLSEESAGGKHPLTVVQAMARIVSYAEGVCTPPFVELGAEAYASNLARGTYELIRSKEDRKVSAAIVFTKDNLDYVRFLSSFRLQIPVIAISVDSTLRRTIRMSYGILAPKLKLPKVGRENLDEILVKLKELGFIQAEDFVYVIDEMKDEKTGADSSYFLYTKVA